MSCSSDSKVIVTGAKGVLGADLCPIFAERYKVVALDVDEMDVRDSNLVFKTLEEVRPAIVVHLAGLRDIDACLRNPEEAYRVNALGAQNVALACQRVGAIMVYVSTLAVFDGTKCEPYTEFDRPNPQSHYSRDLCLGVMQLLETGLYGTYHMVNSGGKCSRYQIAQQIIECANVTSCRLIPCSSAEFPLAAPRPRMEAGYNYHLQLLGLELMRPWQEALKEYIETVRGEK